MTGETTIYCVEIDPSYTRVIFNRVNPNNTSDVWNCSSIDNGIAIELPTDYTVANCFVLEHVGYEDGNYAGHWTLYN